MMGIFAVFAVYQPISGLVGATTRAADRGEEGRIGLPGGKVDPGETPIQALIRECREEGWAIEPTSINHQPIKDAMVDDHRVQWFHVASACRISGHKEAGRVEPIIVENRRILSSGYGNDDLPLI